MSAATQTKTRQWYYAGRRLRSGKIMYAWHDPVDDRTRLFTKPLARNASPGQRYAVEVETGDEGVTVHGTPEYAANANEAPAELAVDEWRTEDRAAAVVLESERRAKKDAEDDELEAALDVLRRHYHAARTWSSRSAFIAYVTDAMTLPPGRSRR